MGLLAPLFVAGLAALALPLLFHLVRRTPHGRHDFSSLMFLAPSPPRLTRRSRLEQILLLLLRLGALALLAFAFARPFLRDSVMLSLGDLPPRRVAILVDVSASMRRGDLWQQAIGQVERELDELSPHDDVALFTFADRLETVARFSSDQEVSRTSSADVVRQRLRGLRPTWAASDLGTALTTLAGELDTAGDVQRSSAEQQLVLISDFQRGSRIDALQAYDWPEQVRLVTRRLVPQRTTNAHARLLDSAVDSPENELRVKVTSAADSLGDQFFVHWASDERAASPGDETAVYVPPGQSRVVRLPRLEAKLLADRIVLRGDDDDFDNTYFVVPPRKQEVTVLYAGNDGADDAQGLQYYLRLAMAGDLLRQVTVQVLEGDNAPLNGPAAPQLVVAARTLSATLQTALKAYVERGGTLVLVPTDRQAAEALPLYFDDVELREAAAGRSENDFSLLGEIDFTHALFAPFANPRYSDFTKIHFWDHRAVAVAQPATTRVVARLDSGDPWILERTLGRGRVLALTSGWHPDDSQLAVSSKFVPLVGGLLDQACGETQPLAGVAVNEPVTLPQGGRGPLAVHLPDGREVAVPAGSSNFEKTEQPGIYSAGSGREELRFAVNLPAAESDTAPLELERLEQLGVPMGKDVTRAEQLTRIQQQRDTELEGRQKVWRWLLVGCLGLLIVETWWAGRGARPSSQRMEAAA